MPSAQQDSRIPVGKKEKRSNGKTLLLLMFALIGFLSFQRLHVSPWKGNNDNALGEASTDADVDAHALEDLSLKDNKALPLPSDSDPPPRFKIIILTMNRFDSLKRLMQSLERSDYLSDHVDVIVRFDLPRKPTPQWQEAVDLFRKNLVWTHGNATVVVAKENMGLRKAWLEAWKPTSDTERAVIFEDDIEVSPSSWYRWLRGAHLAYRDRSDIAGITLQRQTLVPLKTARKNLIPDNSGKPFLYKLVGSIGFSPVASVWMDFLDFTECALASKLSVDTPELVTSDWYKTLDQRTMWTQLFIYFCKYRDLSTLYTFPKNNKALAAHWREKGEHFGKTEGPDFALADTVDVSLEYPSDLTKLD